MKAIGRCIDWNSSRQTATLLFLNVGLIEKIKIRSLTVRSKSTPDNPSHAGVEGYTNYDHLIAIALRNLLIEEGEVAPIG